MKKIILFICAVFFAVGLYNMYNYGFLTEFTADYNTEFAPDFAPTKLTLVKKGMTKDQVLEILGAPFTADDCFQYSRAKSPDKIIPPGAKDFWYTVHVVCFDITNYVKNVGSTRFFN